MHNPPIPARLAAMRPSRLVIVGLAGLVALHIFMLAGHGRGHEATTGIPGSLRHADATTASCCPARTATAEDRAGIDMTVACLAVLAGLLLLRPRSRYQTAATGPERRCTMLDPSRSDPARLRGRSLEELCISLT
jgi:hypothetical protein